MFKYLRYGCLNARGSRGLKTSVEIWKRILDMFKGLDNFLKIRPINQVFFRPSGDLTYVTYNWLLS